MIKKQLTAFESVFTSLRYRANKAGTKDNTQTVTVLLLIKIDPLLLWADSITVAPKATDSNHFPSKISYTVFADPNKTSFI